MELNEFKNLDLHQQIKTILSECRNCERNIDCTECWVMEMKDYFIHEFGNRIFHLNHQKEIQDEYISKIESVVNNLILKLKKNINVMIPTFNIFDNKEKHSLDFVTIDSIEQIKIFNNNILKIILKYTDYNSKDYRLRIKQCKEIHFNTHNELINYLEKYFNIDVSVINI